MDADGFVPGDNVRWLQNNLILKKYLPCRKKTLLNSLLPQQLQDWMILRI